MGISDRIEAFINELLKDESEEWLSLRRNELASIFGCAPSQINYVISTRFSPECGYIVESRRGGGGYLRIKQIQQADVLEEIIKSIGDSVDERSARVYITNLVKNGTIDEKTAAVIFSGVCDSVLPIEQPLKDKLRAGILKNMLVKAAM